MKCRIVTVTLAVAMGLCTVGAAWAQTAQPLDPETLGPVEALGPVFESPPPSGLPLGDFGPQFQESLTRQPAPEPAPDLSRVERDGEWLYELRHRVGQVTLSRLVIGIGALCCVPLAGLAMVSLFRKRARRKYRRSPSAMGETREQRLEDVVASVQFPDRPLTADLRYLDDAARSEPRSANPSVGTRPTGVEFPIDR